MRKIPYWFYILLITLWAGCSYKKQDYEKIKSLSIEMSFTPERIDFFYYKDSLYFYTYNFSTYKNLEVYNQDGKIIHRIDLKKLPLKTDKIKIEMHTLDSIYLFSSKHNLLYLLDKNGTIVKSTRIDSLIYHKTPYTKNRCKYLNISAHKNIIHNKDVLLNVFIIDTSYKETDDIYKSRLFANEQTRKNPQLAYIRNVLDTHCTVILDPMWIGKAIKEEDEDFNMTPTYLFLDPYIICFIPHDRHIYLIKPEDLTLIRKIPIYSEYTELEYKKPKLSREALQGQKVPYGFSRPTKVQYLVYIVKRINILSL